MKKILLVLFFIITVFGFANQTYDDTKFRQDLINWANSKVGANYDMNNRWGSNTFDCSSLVSRAINGAGMTSISGKKSDYGTTANGLYRASGKVISKNDNEKLPIIAGIILTISAIANFFSLPHPTWFIIVGLIIFIPSTLLGHKLYKLKSNGQ